MPSLFVANFVVFSPSIVAFNYHSMEALFKKALIIVTYFYNFYRTYSKISWRLLTSDVSPTFL